MKHKEQIERLVKAGKIAEAHGILDEGTYLEKKIIQSRQALGESK